MLVVLSPDDGVPCMKRSVACIRVREIQAVHQIQCNARLAIVLGREAGDSMHCLSQLSNRTPNLTEMETTEQDSKSDTRSEEQMLLLGRMRQYIG